MLAHFTYYSDLLVVHSDLCETYSALQEVPGNSIFSHTYGHNSAILHAMHKMHIPK